MPGKGVWEAKDRPAEIHLACAEEVNLNKTNYSTALRLKNIRGTAGRRELFFARTRNSSKLGLISIQMSWPRTIVEFILFFFFEL